MAEHQLDHLIAQLRQLAGQTPNQTTHEAIEAEIAHMLEMKRRGTVTLGDVSRCAENLLKGFNGWDEGVAHKHPL